MIFLLILFTVVGVMYATRVAEYKKTDYYKQTQIPYGSMRHDSGRTGEYWTYRNLEGLPGYKKFLFNIYIPKGNGETTEIDVIMLHESGIYVLESKNYSGWIFGSENQQYWTQTLAAKGKSQKSRFFNPIMQNKGHIKWLSNFLEISSQSIFYSYIVFSERCTLKDIPVTSGNSFVINRYELARSVRANAETKGKILTEKAIDAMYARLYPLTQVQEAEKLSHVNDIRRKQAEYENASEGMKCPRCGGTLVKRVTKRGENQGREFLGCSNYPRCKYTKNITK